MIQVSWHPQAKRELFAASRFYEQESSGLGSLFLDAVYEALERLKVHPRSGRVLRQTTRRYVVTRFPYSLVYRLVPGKEAGESLFLLAVAHQRRRPFYWATRR